MKNTPESVFHSENDGVYCTLGIQFYAEPYLGGDEEVVIEVLGQKVILFLGFDGQQLSLCQQIKKTTTD